MKVSTKGRYALRMLIDLAEHQESGFIALKEIAERQKISKQYLEQIIALLNTSDILKSNRGKQGGYKLAKHPSQITVGQILRITEGSIAPVACLEDKVNQCESAAQCRALPMWSDLYRVISDFLDNTSIADITERYHAGGADNYVI